MAAQLAAAHADGGVSAAGLELLAIDDIGFGLPLAEYRSTVPADILQSMDTLMEVRRPSHVSRELGAGPVGTWTCC